MCLVSLSTTLCLKVRRSSKGSRDVKTQHDRLILLSKISILVLWEGMDRWCVRLRVDRIQLVAKGKIPAVENERLGNGRE